jgi:translation initiation factor 2B subunit (eIF-2B alpha/beta/delta family)
VALAFLRELDERLATDTSTSPIALRAAVLAALRTAQAVQPTMGLVHQLSARMLAVADAAVARSAGGSSGVADMRAELGRTIAVERADLAAERAAVAHTASTLITESGAWIATLSSSGAVRDALLATAAAGRRPRALVAEGRPALEGRTLAAALGAAGLPTWLVVDAALPLVLAQATALWIGADAVTDRGVVNKVGSFAAALAAREHSVPVYALADRRRFLPATTPALKIVEMPPDEVWESPAEGVQPRNVYFELVPMPLLRGVVVEDTVLGPTEAAATARERALPEELAR